MSVCMDVPYRLQNYVTDRDETLGICCVNIEDGFRPEILMKGLIIIIY